MKHINLFATVGRGARQCIGTFDAKESESMAEVLADHAQAAHLFERMREGVAPERVKYDREHVGGNVAKKGKK
jgi:hypothetical protein